MFWFPSKVLGALHSNGCNLERSAGERLLDEHFPDLPQRPGRDAGGLGFPERSIFVLERCHRAVSNFANDQRLGSIAKDEGRVCGPTLQHQCGKM